MPPFLIQPPTNRSGDVGDDIELTCVVGGDPAPDIYWSLPRGERRKGDALLHVLKVNALQKRSDLCNPRNETVPRRKAVSYLTTYTNESLFNHCKRWNSNYTAKAIPFIYSFSGNCAASTLICTIMCLLAIYIFPRSVHIFPSAEQADPSWEYIIRSQTHECGNWAPIFLFWEYMFQIFGILSLQCNYMRKGILETSAALRTGQTYI